MIAIYLAVGSTPWLAWPEGLSLGLAALVGAILAALPDIDYTCHVAGVPCTPALLDPFLL